MPGVVVPQIELRWSPEIHKFMPLLNDGVGFEYFTLEFPWSTYPGHFLVSEAQLVALHNQQRHSDQVTLSQSQFRACCLTPVHHAAV